MPTYNPKRSPEMYPARWHEVVTAKPGRHLVLVVETEAEYRRIQRKFESFRASLRVHYQHPTAKAAHGKATRLTAEKTAGGWEVWATVTFTSATLAAMITNLNDL